MISGSAHAQMHAVVIGATVANLWRIMWPFLDGVGDVFEEDEAEDDVLVFRRVHVVAELVGGKPELGLAWSVCLLGSACAGNDTHFLDFNRPHASTRSFSTRRFPMMNS